MGLRRLSATAAALAAALAMTSAAAAADPVLVMHRDGSVTRTQDPFIKAVAPEPAGPRGSVRVDPAPAVRRAAARPIAVVASKATTKTKTKKKKAKKPQVTVGSVLRRLERANQITPSAYQSYLAQWNAALAEEKSLPKAKASQLAAVTTMLHNMAARGAMTPSRLDVLFLTLARNAQWWKSGPQLSYGQRVQFSGSDLEWEYYTGEGIQLQVLGTFGEANGLYEAGSTAQAGSPTQTADYAQLASLLGEMGPLAVQRGGGDAWEYYFDWEGGSPPWVSGMSQGTGLEALANAFKATKNPNYLNEAHSALGILKTAPPTGVAVHGPQGLRFLQYDFQPNTEIINAYLQTLIGLYDYWQVSSDPEAGHLFREGNAQATADLPAFQDGAWSLYQPGQPDDLSYHQLVTGFLKTLCGLTSTPVYCSTGQAFQTDLRTPPSITLQTTKAPKDKSFHLGFALDKPAKVGVVLTDADGKRYLYTSAQCNPGNDYFVAPKLPAGSYTVKLSGTDPAGNYSSTSGTISVG